MKLDIVSALENAAWPALVLNETGLIQRANPAAANVFGEAVEGSGASVSAIWSPENGPNVPEVLARIELAPTGTETLKLLCKSGVMAEFQAYVSPFLKEERRSFLLQLFKRAVPFPAASSEAQLGQFTSGLGLPIDAKGEAVHPESTLAQKQKLDCALQLTRTVALDFNNALTIILGHTSLILSKMELHHPWRGSLVEVEKSAEKAAEVASDLAAFSRQEKDSRSQVAGNLNELVRRTVELFENPGSNHAVWTLELEPRLFTVTFEEAKMQQAFVKILDNAVQSLRENGRIMVRTRNHEVLQPAQDGTIRLNIGDYVCVEVEDSGCGISADVLPRVFEPFFTTKRTPNHRGLGLAWVYGIVTNHGGSVGISSQVNRGTTVRIYLPAQKKIVRDRSFLTDDLSGTQTVLMIDDEELLLTMGEMVLSSFGYRVLTAQSGAKALEIFAANRAQIDLIITDLVMPKMSGRELIDQLRRIAPDIKIICSSGYIRAMNPDEEEMYLQKPFTSLDLLRKVKQALMHLEGS